MGFLDLIPFMRTQPAVNAAWGNYPGPLPYMSPASQWALSRNPYQTAYAQPYLSAFSTQAPLSATAPTAPVTQLPSPEALKASDEKPSESKSEGSASSEDEGLLEKSAKALSTIPFINVATASPSGKSKDVVDKGVDSTTRLLTGKVFCEGAEYAVNAGTSVAGEVSKLLKNIAPSSTTSGASVTGQGGTNLLDQLSKLTHLIRGKQTPPFSQTLQTTSQNLLPQTQQVLQAPAAGNRFWHGIKSGMSWDKFFNIGRTRASQIDPTTLRYTTGALGRIVVDPKSITLLKEPVPFNQVTRAMKAAARLHNFPQFHNTRFLVGTAKTLAGGFTKAAKAAITSPLKFFKEIVGGNWLRGPASYMVNREENGGKLMSKGLFGAVLGGLNIAANALNCLLTGKKGYEVSQKKGESTATSIGKGIKSFLKELARTLFSYEIGAIAYTFIYGMVATPVLGAGLALAGAAFGGVFAGWGFKKVFGSSVEEPPQHPMGPPGMAPIAAIQSAQVRRV